MARKDKDFLGLEVVSLEDASVVGEVDALLIDDNATVAGLVIDLGVYEAKVLAFSDILSIGEDAVMIGAAAAVKPISQDAALEEVAELDVHVSVMTRVSDTCTSSSATSSRAASCEIGFTAAAAPIITASSPILRMSEKASTLAS